ncbi:hypothetical protein LTR36_007189 [Oleoguttula mirabilis]|uniref:Uncharacterized protein n=1 Tax=Oleoguttula mirabilis TaxID=1507867 RepID=A0AAV9JAF0_9PEZI|nr:hypothetical protein LTR36_007189 [Oleoguttula mirabilis]
MPANASRVGFAQGIIIAPYTAPQAAGNLHNDNFCCKISAASMPRSLFDALPWTPSDVSAALGLPVKVAVWPSPDNRVPNNAVLGLFMHVDPAHDKFGKVRYRSMDGAVVVARIDGKELGQKEVEGLLMYLGTLWHAIKELPKAEDEGLADRIGKAKGLAARMLTPEAFGGFFERYLGEQVEAGIGG